MRSHYSKKSAPIVKMEIANKTKWSLAEIAAMPVLGTTVSNWRQRDITLHQHPNDADSVISVGITFDQRLTVVAEETKEMWFTALDYASRGKVYVSQ